MTDHILVSREGAVQSIRFNRPDKKNAITIAMYAQMSQALLAGEADSAIRCHVILGTPGAFTSGNDLQDFMAFAANGDMGSEVLEFLNTMAALNKPFISGVDGLAIGIGTTINMHCDLTFATPNSVFKTPFIDLGLVPEAGSTLLAPTLVGHQRAYALLAMGEAFSAQEAVDAGLIYKVVDPDSLEKTVAECAANLASRAPTAMAHAKRLMKPAPEMVKARIAEEGKLFEAQLTSDEAREAFMAFMTRKK
jgi:enoyl-CoA hydratase/carnithine racemase